MDHRTGPADDTPDPSAIPTFPSTPSSGDGDTLAPSALPTTTSSGDAGHPDQPGHPDHPDHSGHSGHSGSPGASRVSDISDMSESAVFARTTPDLPGVSDPVARLSLDALIEAAAEPPPGALARLLTVTRSVRRPAATTGFAAPYAARVAAMDALLASATPEDWLQEIVEGWTLQQLVAHLAATDSLVAAAIGAPVAGPEPVAGEVLARTADMLAFVAGQPPERTRADWRAQADAICRHAASMDPATPVAPGGMSFAVSDHLLARMLETWIHADDAATVIGHSLPLPLAAHIHPTADFCARLLPWTMLLSGTDGGGRAIRLTLTGPGGGAWHVPLDVARTAVPDDGSPADAAITCDAVAFCFLLGGRGAPATFPAEVEGDAGLARDVLHSAPALSGP
ncbi:maleylpyruvate isomerase family mycothiol-dependent enzyme [Sphaerisporangium perillae]|uniref:maleylpyruvate isomerase family mycothiol-dependent enzyme n=1 Tax=Sphaerisporangium perillae TaxID=2935860 RepID=UPI00200C23E7|nr:maleylpyruvate isomerase family mycothiol-dependent enzyme [Sphaerisporangium perillae]